MFIFCYKRCLSAFSTQPVWRQTIPTCASTTMALALLFVKQVIRQCVCVCMCNYDHVQENHSTPKILRQRGLNKKEKNSDGCIDKGNGVSCNHSFIIFTPLKMAIDGILIPYTAYHETYLTKA